MNDPIQGEVQLDFDRRRRTGLDEAVLAMGKTCAQLEVIFSNAMEQKAALLITRLHPDKYAQIAARWAVHLDYCSVSQTAIFGFVEPPAASCRVAIVAAGSSDVAVAREAQRTLAYYGVACRLFVDVGVAGLWRLTQRLDDLRRCAVVIAVAGMDAALPTVLAGLIPGTIIAVPTSVGYGVSAGGKTALHALLSSCAQGITVVNIDNGFGAACAAVRTVRAIDGAAGQNTAAQAVLGKASLASAS